MHPISLFKGILEYSVVFSTSTEQVVFISWMSCVCWTTVRIWITGVLMPSGWSCAVRTSSLPGRSSSVKLLKRRKLIKRHVKMKWRILDPASLQFISNYYGTHLRNPTNHILQDTFHLCQYLWCYCQLLV